MKKAYKSGIRLGIIIAILTVPFAAERILFQGAGPLWFYISAIVPWGTQLVPAEMLCLTVVDEDGNPVEDADVRATHYHGVGTKRRVKKGRTDANGYVALKGKTLYCDFGIRVSKEGYYSTSLSLDYYKDFPSLGLLSRKGNKWIPYGLEKTLVLKKMGLHENL